MLKDVSSSAAALYDGGWRSADADQLRTEYDLTEEETQELCAALADLEEKNKSSPPRPRWRGFSFALHLLRAQGFYFCPAAYKPRASVYNAFFAIYAKLYSLSAKSVYRALQGRFR